jgi:hypothetical protein
MAVTMKNAVFLYPVAPVRTNVSEEHIASIIRVTRIHELGTIVAASSNRRNTMSQRASVARYC